MHSHRFREQGDGWRLPAGLVPVPSAAAFVLCPPALLPRTPEEYAVRQHLYALAFREALAVVRPSLPERDLLGVWN